MKESIGKIIKRLRKENEMTQEELAEALNISAVAVSKWENELTMPDISQIIPLANIFGVTTDELFGLTDVDHEQEIREKLGEIFKFTDNIKDNEKASGGLEALEMYRSVLKTYPNNPTVLINAASFGSYLTSYYEKPLEQLIGREGLEKIVDESIKWCELAIKYAKTQDDVFSAKRTLVDFYTSRKNFDKAFEIVDTFVSDINSLKYIYLASLKWSAGQSEEQKRLNCKNIKTLSAALVHQAIMLGNIYMNNEKRYEDALYCYRYANDLVEALFKEEQYRPPYCDSVIPLYCFPAKCLIKLGRTKEAAETLEKAVDFMEIQEKNYNKKTEFSSPLMVDCHFSYGFEGSAKYEIEKRIRQILVWLDNSGYLDDPNFENPVRRMNEILAEKA
ncbi:MAG: helix-turn-helix transcriptional regulator [Ruminococcaceae bacterium]|nr:helix-turn-helix transcriptional regulator [Oscillospiraceae bacterium]